MQTQVHTAPALAPTATDRFTALATLPAGEHRVDTVTQVLTPLLASRNLPGWVAPRWLASATEVLARPDELELFVQHDPVLETVTIGLWHDGTRLFETDVWIG